MSFVECENCKPVTSSLAYGLQISGRWLLMSSTAGCVEPRCIGTCFRMFCVPHILVRGIRRALHVQLARLLPAGFHFGDSTSYTASASTFAVFASVPELRMQWLSTLVDSQVAQAASRCHYLATSAFATQNGPIQPVPFALGARGKSLSTGWHVILYCCLSRSVGTVGVCSRCSLLHCRWLGYVDPLQNPRWRAVLVCQPLCKKPKSSVATTPPVPHAPVIPLSSETCRPIADTPFANALQWSSSKSSLAHVKQRACQPLHPQPAALALQIPIVTGCSFFFSSEDVR